jgi:hypothetical protein
MRLAFNRVFRFNPDRTITPIVPVRIGPATMPANSAAFPPDAISFGNIRISDFLNRDLEVNVIDGVYEIQGYYPA